MAAAAIYDVVFKAPVLAFVLGYIALGGILSSRNKKKLKQDTINEQSLS